MTTIMNHYTSDWDGAVDFALVFRGCLPRMAQIHLTER